MFEQVVHIFLFLVFFLLLLFSDTGSESPSLSRRKIIAGSERTRSSPRDQSSTYASNPLASASPKMLNRESSREGPADRQAPRTNNKSVLLSPLFLFRPFFCSSLIMFVDLF
jgi:hypothetical protein